MEKICLIRQPAGIGDILYCQAIVKHYINLGYTVIYPVNSNLTYLNDYLKHDGLKIVDINENFPYKEHYTNKKSILTGDFIFLNLDQSHTEVGGGYMTSKYNLVGLDQKKWVSDLVINRNVERENLLYYDHLGLSDGEEYILLNTKYGTPPNFAEFPIPKLDTNKKLVNMVFIDGTNILDWMKVIENASGIVTVDTCIQYIMEKLDIDYEFYHCYLRDGGKGRHYNIIKDIFTIPWNYINLN